MKIDLPKVINFTSNKDNYGSKGNAVNLKDKKLSSENIQNDEDFIPFMPFLPVDNLSLEEKEVNIEYTESFQSLQFLTSSMQQLLQSNILIFLRNVFHNPEFLLFIQSYLSHRTKPIFSRVDASKEVSNSLLFKLDRMVFQCYYRILSQDHEYKTISQYLPKTKVMIVLPSDNLENDNEANSTPVDTEALFPQYRKLVTNLEILKFPYLLDFIGIMGQSNIPLLSKEIIQNLLYWREESFQTEMLLSFKEIHVTLRQLVQNIHQFYQKFVNYYENQKNISKKKLQAIQQQQLQQQQNALFSKIKDEKYELLLQFYDFYLFIKDILYSLYLFFQIIDVQWIRLSPFYCCLGETLSPEYGVLMIECLEIFIEIFVSYIDLIQELHTRSYVTSLLQFSLFQDKIQEVLGQFQDTKLFIEEYAFQIMKQLFSFANYSIPNKPNTSSENNSYAGGGLRRLNSRKISDPILAKTSSWTEGKPPSSSPPSYQIWKEILKKKLDLSFFILDQSTPPLLIQRNGTFFMHFFKNGEMLKSFISFYCILGGKKDEIEGIMENFQKMSMTATLPPPPPPAASSTAASTASSKPTASSLPPPSKEMIANIQSIFPDLGDGFIESCLIFYKNNSEELIDALLMDNLAPALSSLDRRMMKVSLGKNTLLEGQTLASKPTAIPILPPPMSSPTSSIASTSTAGGAGRKGQTQKNEISSEVIFQPTNQFQSLQRQVLSTIEQKQKYDAYIVDTMIMYDDDYDDQYDESIAWKGHPTSRPIRAYSEEYDDEDEDGPPAVVVEPVGKKGGNNKQQKEAEKIDWDKQMKETKRYNDMIKEEAKEILFWKEMENTNRNQKGVRGGKDAWKYEQDEEEQGEQPTEGKVENLKTSADSSKPLPQGPGGRGGTGGGGGGRGQGRGEGGRGGRGGGKGSGGGGGNKNELKPQSASQDSADSTNPNSQQKKSHKPHFDKHHQKDKALRKTGGFF